jgi:hypothetical protein
MAQIYVTMERPIGAPAERVYSYIADYRQHHPTFLPPNFLNFAVEEGGVGAGTVFRFTSRAGGRTRAFHMDVAEPEPGRVLTEADRNSSIVTTWTVTPTGDTCRVRIETRWRGARGIGGFFERLFAPRMLRRVYEDELGRLDRYARTQASTAGDR